MSCRKAVVVCTLAFGMGAAADAQQSSSSSPSPHPSDPVITAIRTTEPPVIDGRLTEESWSRAIPADQFTQRDPAEGKSPTERTEVRVLYDADALYVGVRMYDGEPQKIARRLSNRDDNPDADRFVLYLDPRHDHVTGVEFMVSAAGVQRDAVISNDTNEDVSWDAVWISAVAVDGQGWTAELEIPFSQLRFNAADQQIWGINASRYIQRKNETVWLALVLKNENGLASRMAHLAGLEGVRPVRHVELAPYTAAREELVKPVRAADPFNDGSRLFGSVGLDLKARVTGSLTLDATINPDFGQAEVDPAVVNLSAFETFFEEKRRFFIEGAEIFNNFGSGGANNFFGFNSSDPQIFYSRRIGRPPQAQAQGDFVDAPKATTILGAGKLTGKTAHGWSIGILDAVASRERASVLTASRASTSEIEPRTNYFVARVQRDFARAGTGLLATSVVRSLRTSPLRDQLAGRSYVLGGDGFYFFDRKKEWVVTGKMSGSRVTGSRAAIALMQRAPQRYYQRPDAPEVSFDPGRTSLSGWAGRVNLNRNSGVWRVNAALWGVSPGFDSNALGFHSMGDRAGGHAVLLWRNETTNRWTRSRHAWVARAWTWNFNREVLGNLWFWCGDATFINYWGVNTCGSVSHRTFDDRLTRGGPLALTGAGRFVNVGVSSDSRKWISAEVFAGHDWDEFGGWSINQNATVTVKPLASLSVSTGPQLNRSKVIAQYVGSQPDSAALSTYGERYIFAGLDQTQLTLTTRINWILSPRMSVRVFMQPLLATGAYGDFKELAAPGTFVFRDFRGTAGFTFSQDPVTRAYSISEDTGTSGPFTFDNPDFNFKSLKVNSVFRWEFHPGSTLYAVWTQQREDVSHAGEFRFARDASALFSAPANNVFLLKVTYWMGK